MTAPTTTALGAAVLGHLQAQIESARRLLECILRQGAAVRGREVDAVLASMTEIQAEMGARSRMESDRARLLTAAGASLGIPPANVTLEAMTRLMGPAEAELARVRSAELRGLLAEIAREHGVNRALMRQELTFLGHLTRLIGGEPQTGYRPPAAAGRPGAGEPPAIHRVLNVQA
jgi:flagellar FlgN protein